MHSPTVPLVRLDVRPRLASWNANDDPEQLAVQAYLDDVEAAVRPAVTTSAPLYLRTHAVVPDVLRGHDVENYLTPLAQRLRDPPIVLTHGTKAAEGQPFVEVGLVDDGTPPVGWSSLEARVTGSAGRKVRKQALRQALVDDAWCPPTRHL